MMILGHVLRRVISYHRIILRTRCNLVVGPNPTFRTPPFHDCDESIAVDSVTHTMLPPQLTELARTTALWTLRSTEICVYTGLCCVSSRLPRTPNALGTLLEGAFARTHAIYSGCKSS